MTKVHILEGQASARNLGAQIMADEQVEHMVAAVRKDGRWYFLNSEGIDTGAMAFAIAFMQWSFQQTIFEDDE